MPKAQKYRYICITVALFGLSMYAGWLIRGAYLDVQIRSNPPDEIRENTNAYNYINPLLLVNFPYAAPEYGKLKEDINSSVVKFLNQGDATSISVYFQDLNSGKWTGAHEDELYTPSSMLKVAVMVGYLNEADNNPEVLSKKLDYVASNNVGQYYKPSNPLKTGSYTVAELIRAMIIDSDNTALELLYNNNRAVFVNVLKELEIPSPISLNDRDFMSPRTYSRIFRTLFSSSYLSRDLSEKALQLLTYTTFKNGLVAGAPTSTIIAHKFGEHTDASNDIILSHQLHDCGIVYYPHKPYFLCVMTRGNDFSKLESIISSISTITYNDIKN